MNMEQDRAFNAAFRELIGEEGGYVFNPADPGGETKYGITKRCLSPDTKVLTADLRWVAISTLVVGDTLLAFDEEPERHGKLNLRRLREASVLSIGPVRLPSSKITTEKRTIIASDDHQWLMRRGAHRVYRWSRTSELLSPVGKFGHKNTKVRIASFMEPWARIDSRSAGYVAGILDGEGHISKAGRIGFSQKENACLSQAERALQELGVEFAYGSFRHDVRTINIKNTNQRPYYSVEVAGKVGAERLLANAARQLIGKSVASTCGAPEEVLSVESIGETDLIGIETSTKTLIAEGLLSHNSYPSLNIKELDLDTAKAIYYKDFWLPLGDQACLAVRLEVFDFAVNSGIQTAIRKLQSAIGVADDGHFGPVSRAKLASLPSGTVVLRYLSERLAFMASLSTWPNFGRGWARRIARRMQRAADSV